MCENPKKYKTNRHKNDKWFFNVSSKEIHTNKIILKVSMNFDYVTNRLGNRYSVIN